MSSALIQRRALVLGGTALGIIGLGTVAGTALYDGNIGEERTTYDGAAEAIRSPIAAAPSLRELVRYATLAANSHNAQAWKFRIVPRAITILPDFARRTPAVDPEDHHLFVSLGCATENLIVAAAARGFEATANFDNTGDGSIEVALEAAAAKETASFASITRRQMTRADYDGVPVPAGDLDALLVSAQSDKVEVILITDKARIDRILSLVVEGNNTQYDDPTFVAELKKWVRFNDAEALSTRDGLFSRTTGNPPLPSWFGRTIFSLVVTASEESDKVAKQIRSSAGLAVFIGQAADRSHWIDVGRAYQRFGLVATALGIKHAFVNQAVEVAAVREMLAIELGIPGRRPDLLLRFGYAATMPRSLRRTVAEVTE